ncbi:hemolysin family protein [Haloglycomyces albus]|uniref:hemolysin family protein n=1 Tax=Haloglycomyces albus TaxID=526067 RepID=UPI0004A32411|nr:hemolysin family protein [Haloglycomyces albus]
MSELIAILLTVVLLAGNAFFVGSEFALLAVRRSQIELRATEGSRIAKLTLKAIERVSLMMAGAQLGITACSLGLGAIGEPAIAALIEQPMRAVGITGALLHGMAFTIAMSIVVFLHMVLGEMVPKNIAIAGPERSAMALGPILYGMVLILRPFIALLNGFSNLVLRLFRVEPKDEVASAFTAEEVSAFIAESHREGLLDEEERRLLSTAIELDSETLSSALVPLNHLVALPHRATPAQAEAEFLRTGFSRFPLADDNGVLNRYVHLKDLLGLTESVAEEPIPYSRTRPLSVLSVDTALDDALDRMQADGAHLALVEENGDTIGAAMLGSVVQRLAGTR